MGDKFHFNLAGGKGGLNKENYAVGRGFSGKENGNKDENQS